MDKQNRIQRLRLHALMDVQDGISEIRLPLGDGPLGPGDMAQLGRALQSANRALSRLRSAPNFSAWPDDQPPNSAEALRRLRMARKALTELLKPARGPMTGRKRNHELKEIPAHYAPREKTYPR